jgi:cell wall-associated NlpC family hydrolase
MRNLGDLSWVNDYINIPYVIGGRDMSGVDCYGLCKLVYHNEYGIDLPDWLYDEFDLRGREKIISSVVCSGEFKETDDPIDGDFVVCSRTKAAYHVGLYFAGGVLHAHRESGSVYEPLSRFQRSYVKVTFGDWTP